MCVCNCFHSMPIACNVSLTDYCPASLYFVPTKPISIEETAALFRVNAGAINKTVDGFAIMVNCSCPAEHDWFVWRTDYTIEWGDTWESISLKFGSFVVKKPEKQLFDSQTVTLDLLCSCSKGQRVVTYRVVTGDTLFTICSRFGADLNETEQLNRLPNPSLIHSGDVVFIPTSGLGHLLVDANDSEVSRTSKNRSHVYLEILLSVVAVILVLSVFIFLVHRKRRKHEQSEPSAGLECSPSCFTFLSSSIGCSSLPGLYSSSKESGDSVISAFSSEKSTVFQYSEVLDATSNFSASLKIGQGSYGSVYLGKLRGTDVAIKQMKNTKSKEFLAELNILCKVHHTNLIELIGYASGGDSLFLVYEFAQNGALSDHLHNPAMRGYKSLPWTTRVGIALDAAKGLEYIHMHTKPYYVHRDVKTSNILLDSNFRAKIADFGLVKLLESSPESGATASKVVGTFGYLAPEYIRDGCVTAKSDVYSYGVVLMELITGKPALSRTASTENNQCTEHRSVVTFMLSALEDDHNPMAHLVQCVDPNLTHYHKDSLLQVALLSKDCVDDDRNRRPDMSKVAVRLSHILECSMEWEGGGWPI
ncbi:hypothetical protein MRB53_006294 [Persea americana]|uniref:Uncharacterized protein n=1 Tax=Persea americana TaxID=3435 RepID=A0ACC2MFK4_PERAE|nr:hypothetical protein MRB53_006294 [Persea americana]